MGIYHDIGRNYPSWGLKAIAEYEGFVDDSRQFYDASQIGKNWDNLEERKKIINYCRDDGKDSIRIFELMAPSFFYLTQSISKPFQEIINGASGSWLNNIMIRAYLQDGNGIPTPSSPEYVAGGMSYGVPGIYTNVSKWDAASYYPSTIITYKLYDEIKDPEAYYYKITKHFTEERFKNKRLYKETKNKYYDDMQASLKIGINSLYGLTSTPGLNYNNFKMAQKITRLCRKGLQKAIIWATGKDVYYWWEEYKDKKSVTQDAKDFSEVDSKAELSIDNMPRHDWVLVNIDTDAISFAKKDGSNFTKDDKKLIEKEINQIMYSQWEPDGKFEKFVVFKAKNYAMVEDGKKTVKGSSIMDPKKEKALSEMLQRCIDELLDNNVDNCYKIFDEYAEEIQNIKDISRWTTKKSITETMLASDRLQEQKIKDAIEGTNYQIGDKVYVYNDVDGEIQDSAKGELLYKRMLKSEYEALGFEKKPKLETCTHSDRTTCRECNPDLYVPKMIPNRILKRQEEFDGSYDIEHYMQRLYATIEILGNVVDMEKVKRYDKYKK